jgi:hypothetical protein
MFGDESGVVGDMDGTAYALSLPGTGDIVSVGSSTQASLARVGGFGHRIPQSSPDTSISIPVASGSARTDIISLRYDPTFTGLPGPVRLNRIVGVSALNLATVTRMFPWMAPVLTLPTGAALPLNSPLGTTCWIGSVEYRRVLVGVTPTWSAVLDPAGPAPAAFSFAAGFTNFNTSIYESVQVYKDALGLVHIEGVGKNNNIIAGGPQTTLIGTLGAGFRPTSKKPGFNRIVAVDKAVFIEITTAGAVNLTNVGTGGIGVGGAWAFDLAFNPRAT